MTFSIGFCFLLGETTEDFIWAFQCFKELGINPSITVMDRDNAQKRASESIYLETPTLLCIWYVNQCVLAKCKPIVGDTDWSDFQALWQSILKAPTIEEYEKRWLEFKTQYSNPKTYQCIVYL
jgi:hypothetical protein